MSLTIYGKISSNLGLITREGPNFANGNFANIFSLLGYEYDIKDSEIEGGELEILKNRLLNLLQIIEHKPDEFTTQTIIYHQPGKAIVIEQGKDVNYYETRLQEILDFIQNAQKIWFI
jgi:hypothetical protein